MEKRLFHFIQASRSAGSWLGEASGKAKKNGKIWIFESEDAARAEAAKLNAQRGSANVHYAYGGELLVYADEFKKGYSL